MGFHKGNELENNNHTSSSEKRKGNIDLIFFQKSTVSTLQLFRSRSFIYFVLKLKCLYRINRCLTGMSHGLSAKQYIWCVVAPFVVTLEKCI